MKAKLQSIASATQKRTPVTITYKQLLQSEPYVKWLVNLPFPSPVKEKVGNIRNQTKKLLDQWHEDRIAFLNSITKMKSDSNEFDLDSPELQKKFGEYMETAAAKEITFPMPDFRLADFGKYEVTGVQLDELRWLISDYE